jgi:phosphoglycerate dehydrogenase-like enzyme
VHVLGIRSRTQVTEDVLAAADRLFAIGCFCIGTNQVDLDAAAHRGIPVFNAPFSNTRSVAELTLGEIVMLMRGIFPKSNAAHRGDWDKSAANSWEVRGKTLGIVGYGNIGSQLLGAGGSLRHARHLLGPHRQAAAWQCPADDLPARAAGRSRCGDGACARDARHDEHDRCRRRSAP